MMSNKRSRQTIRGGALAAVAIAAVLGVAGGSVYSYDWTISDTNPIANSTWHTTDTIEFRSHHWAQFHRVGANMQNDSVTVWGKNGYTKGGGPTLVGSTSDAASWQGTGIYDWYPTLDPIGTVSIPTTGSASAWFKTTYKANNMTSEELVTRASDGTSAFVSYSITITN